MMPPLFDRPRKSGRRACRRALSSAPGRTPATRARPRAFTLVELLTVIAIVAVLASLLLTAVGSAKRKSKTVVSTFNLHQITLALTMYLDDFGKRPPNVDELLTARYLPEPKSLICPEDKTGNWGGLVQAGTLSSLTSPVPGSPPSPVVSLSGVSHSYLLHPLNWGEATWNRLMQEGGSAGVAACQLHGLGRQDAPSIYSFEGLLLRAQRDGAVVRRQLFWNAALVRGGPPSPGAVNFNDFGSGAAGVADPYAFPIYLDDLPDWLQTGP